MFISAYDQARFGLLTMRNGRWGNRQLISESWIQMSRTPTAVQPDYGFMNYFLNTGKKRLPSAPESVYMHLGNGTNAIICDPEHDLVVVVRWIDANALDGLMQRVLASLTDAKGISASR
jgi:CubicO group peptidase (beta-lactamase class C family)